jgi:nitroreductase
LLKERDEEMTDHIETRRSIRHFSKKAVEKEKVMKLLRAAMQAPSAHNQRPWEFLVIEDEDKRRTLASVTPYAGPTARAPLAIIMLANEEELKAPDFWQQDMAAATQNLLLRAVDLGLGTVWMGVGPDESRRNYIRKIFSIPASIKPFAIIACGYPAEDKEQNHLVDRFREERVHFEIY